MKFYVSKVTYMETIKPNTFKLGILVHLIPFFTLYAKETECGLFLGVKNINFDEFWLIFRIGCVGYVFHLGHLHRNYLTYCMIKMLSGPVFWGKKHQDLVSYMETIKPITLKFGKLFYLNNHLHIE